MFFTGTVSCRFLQPEPSAPNQSRVRVRAPADPEVDLANAEELKANEKERAENLMIVDLMRNDLGRVAKPDTVRVSKLFEIESYATVHQLVSTVEAELAEGQDAFSAFESSFPGGSMTGAPKAKAMEIIQEPRSGQTFGLFRCPWLFWLRWFR